MTLTGEKFPTAAVTAGEAPWNDTGCDWVTPTNIFADDGNTANVTAATFDSPDQTFVLKASGFDFSSIPDGSTINGVIVRVNAWFRSGQGAGSLDLCQLLNTSLAKVGTNQCATPVALTTTTTTIITKGSAVDLWGNALTAAWVKNSNFGVALGCVATAANADVDIDYVTIEIDYTPPAAQNLNIPFTDFTEQLFAPTLTNQSPLSVSVGFYDAPEQLFAPALVKTASLRYPSTAGLPTTPDSDPTNYILGLAFTVSEDCDLVNLYFWCAGTARPGNWALWSSTGAGTGNKTKIGSNHTASWSNAGEQDVWIRDIAFTTPIALTAGTMYIIGLQVIEDNIYSAIANHFSVDRTVSILTGEASSQAHDGNGVFTETSDLTVCPTSVFNATDYLIDIAVTIPTAQSLAIPFFDNTESLFAPTFVKNLEIPLLDNVESLFAPSFIKDLETSHIASTVQFFAPTLTNAGGAQNLEIPFHQQSTGFFVMSISNQSSLNLDVGHLASVTQIFTPTIESQSAQSVAPSRIESTVQLFAPTLVNELSVNPNRIESTVQLFIPVIENQASLNLSPGFITSTLVIPVPSLSLQTNINLSVSFVQFVPMFFAPSLSNEGGDLFEPILAGNGSLIDRVMNGLITQGFLVGTITDRERLRLLNRALLADPQNLSMMDLYRVNAEPNRLYEIGIDVL